MSWYARVEKLELCYDPARDRRAIAQVKSARDIRDDEDGLSFKSKGL